MRHAPCRTHAHARAPDSDVSAHPPRLFWFCARLPFPPAPRSRPPRPARSERAARPLPVGPPAIYSQPRSEAHLVETLPNLRLRLSSCFYHTHTSSSTPNISRRALSLGLACGEPLFKLFTCREVLLVVLVGVCSGSLGTEG
jgi:hypothetical protein